MKLAALQLMQQKASKVETPTSLENGSPLSLESKSEDPLGPEAGSEGEGSSASGLAKVKELAETIASDDGTGAAAVGAGGAGSWCLPPVTQDPVKERQRDISARSWGRLRTVGPPVGEWAASQRAMSPQQTHGAGR